MRKLRIREFENEVGDLARRYTRRHILMCIDLTTERSTIAMQGPKRHTAWVSIRNANAATSQWCIICGANAPRQTPPLVWLEVRTRAEVVAIRSRFPGTSRLTSRLGLWGKTTNVCGVCKKMARNRDMLFMYPYHAGNGRFYQATTVGRACTAVQVSPCCACVWYSSYPD